jgi:hypothetical protein
MVSMLLVGFGVWKFSILPLAAHPAHFATHDRCAKHAAYRLIFLARLQWMQSPWTVK